MEQHTWPHASAGHVFSSIPATNCHWRPPPDLGPLASDGSNNNNNDTSITDSDNIENRAMTSSCGRDQRGNHHHSHQSHNRHHHRESEDNSRSQENHRSKTRKQCSGASSYGDPRKQSKMSWSETSASINKHIGSLLSASRPDCNPNTRLGKLHVNYVDFKSDSSSSSFMSDEESSATRDFAMLPDDILLRIAGAFSWPNLWCASLVCKSWSQALAPLREAMLFLHWGKKFKHGRGGISRNIDKALDSFLKGAKRGCAAAMVDAGLLYWEMGQRQEGLHWYTCAAELGDPSGQCNLGLAYLQDPHKPAEAVKWFQKAALAGHVRAQYSLALCLQQGRGIERNAVKAARWYQHAAEGGSARAMYNLSVCYKTGEGISSDLRESRKWMKRAALAGHRKAQFEHGLTLFAESDGGLALVFLELATRAGETAATHLRDALLQQLSPKTRMHAISCADKWQARHNARGY